MFFFSSKKEFRIILFWSFPFSEKRTNCFLGRHFYLDYKHPIDIILILWFSVGSHLELVITFPFWDMNLHSFSVFYLTTNLCSNSIFSFYYSMTSSSLLQQLLLHLSSLPCFSFERYLCPNQSQSAIIISCAFATEFYPIFYLVFFRSCILDKFSFLLLKTRFNPFLIF